MRLAATEGALPFRFDDDKTPVLLAAGWAVCLTCYALLGVWLAAHPPVFASDDALNFTRALTHFDILDFSPQFPGYPGFVALGRLMLPFTATPAGALLATTITITLALPPAAAWLAWRVSCRSSIALAAFAVTLTQPLLPDLALSMLSDGSGILFLLIALSCLVGAETGNHRRAMTWLAGIAIGFGLCCRPSDAPLYAGALAALAWRLPARLPGILGGALLVGVPIFAVVYAIEGPLYIWAALHFVAGHTAGWGNTAFSAGGANGNWLASIAAMPGALPVAVLIVVAVGAALRPARTAPPVLTAIVFAFVAHALWIVLMQNPAHLRHLTPLAVLGALTLVLVIDGAGPRCAAVGALIVLNVYTLVRTVDLTPDLAPPLARATVRLRQIPHASAVAVNEGVNVLRRSLPSMHVFDMRHPAHVALGIAALQGSAYRLSTTPLGVPPLAVYRGRVPGETTMRLYRFDKKSAQPASG